jgi:hypothetical protein
VHPLEKRSPRTLSLLSRNPKGGLIDGHRRGVPGKTHLDARLRSTRDQALAEKPDRESGADNVMDLFAQQTTTDRDRSSSADRVAAARRP